MDRLSPLITTTTALKELVTKARNCDAVAMDTEFFWERTYYPRLGLVQLALSDEECYLVDPLTIKDIEPLGKLLSDRSVVKIFHDAPQDLVILQQATGSEPQNIFDTRLAAGFANFSATLSLANLIQELLDIQLPKNQTRTDWLKRPLTDNQINYAVDDVRYLRAVRILLLNRIIGPKIRYWLQEELNLLNNPANYSGATVKDRFRKIRGSSSLDKQSLAILKNLSTWRDGMAKKIDRPRGHIIKDALLLELARLKPSTPEQLQEQTSISTKAGKKYAETLVAIITTTLSQNPSSYPEPTTVVRMSKGDKESLARLNNLIHLKCELLGIDPALIGNNSELKRLVKTLRAKHSANWPQLRQTDGWRKNFLEDFFRQNQ
jgi:ribonuclease D